VSDGALRLKPRIRQPVPLRPYTRRCITGNPDNPGGSVIFIAQSGL